MTAAELVASKKHILLDFDGPICAAFAGYGSTNISRELATVIAMDGFDVPPHLHVDSDPFQLLRYAASHANSDLLARVDREFRRLEIQAIKVAPPTRGALEALHELVNSGHMIVIVSNNSEEAVQTYLKAHDVRELFAGVSARACPDPSLLKPNPHLLHRAIALLRTTPTDCVMVGDSPSDIQAAHQAGTRSIAFVNKSRKSDALATEKADASITSMMQLIQQKM